MFNMHDRQITQFDHDLENQLDRATVVPARQVPPDVVTMNSPAAWVSCWSASCPAGDGGCG